MLPQAVERLLPAARAHCPLVSLRRALSGMRRGLRRRKGAKRAAAQRAPEACPLYPPLEGVRGGTSSGHDPEWREVWQIQSGGRSGRVAEGLGRAVI